MLKFSFNDLPEDSFFTSYLLLKSGKLMRYVMSHRARYFALDTWWCLTLAALLLSSTFCETSCFSPFEKSLIVFHKHLVSYSKFQMGIIPIVEMCITGRGGIDSLLCQPINLFPTVKIGWRHGIPLGECPPTYLEVWQIGVAHRHTRKKREELVALQTMVLYENCTVGKKIPLFIVLIIEESAHDLDEFAVKIFG